MIKAEKQIEKKDKESEYQDKNNWDYNEDDFGIQSIQIKNLYNNHETSLPGDYYELGYNSSQNSDDLMP